MRGLIAKIIGDPNQRELKKLNPIVEKVNSFDEQMRALADDELRNKTTEFKQRLDERVAGLREKVEQERSQLSPNADATERRVLEEAEKELYQAEQDVLWEILPEAYAVVREAGSRVLGMRHFDVQVLGGIVLHQGRISEMKTGEGKTLVATLPAYLNALTGRGVHIITVNDYLASRDREWMGPLYEFLGLSVGLIVHGLDPVQRRESYAADITYGTNNEFGFDYLRDNMVLYREQLVQRPLHYTIVDEVDSILIDEARTPLIISGQMKDDKQEEDYSRVDSAVSRLKEETHFTVDEKAHSVVLTEEGEEKVESLLGERGLYGEEDIVYEEVEEEQAQGSQEAERRNIIKKKVENALKAYGLMKRDRNYVVKDGQIIIVDEFTGRLMYGRRYSDGLHQAIEAKEKVKVAKESMTLASITFQNYFRMYSKLAGMTGTARTEEAEFQAIYGMDVVEIPTNKPMIRQDLPDAIYKTEKGKFRWVVEEIVERHNTGQPLLVGTISIETSEDLSRMLQKRGIAHEVLNAKQHDREAKIVAQAGRLGAVTIATNMAGRGTDIVLGGNHESLAEDEFRSEKGMHIEDLMTSDEVDEAAKEAARKRFGELLEKYERETKAEREKVVAAGGLHIIGTERHESRRIDNQLRGRSGRQGDAGSSQFYISLEDDLMRLFGGDNIFGVMEKLGLDEDTQIDHPLITRAIETAQKKVEARNFDIRKHILEYDDVINEQREVIYSQRRRVLEGENLRDTVMEWVPELIDDAIAHYASEQVYEDEWDLAGLLEWAEAVFLPPRHFAVSDLQEKNRDEIREMLLQAAFDFYSEREEKIGAELMREAERVVILRAVDTKWMNHIDAMDDLRHGVGLRAYGQRNPLVEYKYEAYEMFNEMIRSLKEEAVGRLYRVEVKAPPKRQAVAVTNETPPSDGTAVHGPAKSDKVGRNAPCPCGSGKKHKKCCGK
ncbi:preprotein translocase subunit SecA [Dethiobacter alkaliphilus]|uniref:Protein translocase subunit SecA n=1 Tax=Dethiobacter alkaliphilus AHT 1 TaxID=555088 RepID=C0GF86_DETAL|nr:preprotein translocase subunit SecA [Dethiobacter alkaliphilus]EEG77846.1 preprotein translocase, SecA subunit [Dethiobacter alkaliphilus AHT 1]